PFICPVTILPRFLLSLTSPRPPLSALFPYTTLFRSLCCQRLPTGVGPEDQRPAEQRPDVLVYTTAAFAKDTEVTGPVSLDLYVRDRKSTRLNSSHVSISYAVFCLKKKMRMTMRTKET